MSDGDPLAIRRRLVEWDVLGVYQDENRPDDDNEYDDLIAPVLRWMSEGAEACRLSARIVGFLRKDYGLNEADVVAVMPLARSLIAWSESSA